MLTTKVVQESLTSILDSLSRSELDEAKKKIQTLAPELKSDRDKGALLAASGIYSSISKSKEGTLQSWDGAKIERAARSITANQLADDFDTGYAEALRAYVKLIQSNRQSAE